MNSVNRYFFSSFLETFISLFATLFLIMSIVFFIQIARIVSYIEINFGELCKLFLFMMPKILLFTLPIAFFVSVAMSFFRLSKENESTVIFTLGYSPKKIANFFLLLGAIFSILLLINSLIIMPLAQNLNENFINNKKMELNLNIKTGEFGQKFDDWMIFIDDKTIQDGKTNYKNIIMYNINKDSQRLISAASGNIENNNSNIELHLNDGKIYDIFGDKWHISTYEDMLIRTFMKNQNQKDGTIIEYWSEIFKSDKRAKDLTIYTLVALFPLVSVLFGLSFGIVTYRYEKGIVYFGVFGVLFAYFAMIMLFAKYPIYAIPLISLLFFAASFFSFNAKIIKKY